METRHIAQRSLRVEIQKPDGVWVKVGNLNHSHDITWFESDAGYWETSQRPILGQIFEERGRSWRPSARMSLPNWFSQLLPEGMLRSAVARAAGVDSKREFFLLARIGRDDLHGAVRVQFDESANLSEPPEVSEEHETDDSDNPYLKFSLAGAQLKFSVVRAGKTGLTISARGEAGNWIVKLPDGRAGFDGVPEAELGAMELARRVGIEVPETMMIKASNIPGLPKVVSDIPGDSFAVKRYDRLENGGRVHAEELAQILDIPTGNEFHKYRRANFETVASVIGGLCGRESVGLVLDRIILNILIGNGDAHLKNWSVVYPDGRIPILSPLYDVVPTVLYMPTIGTGLNLNRSQSFGVIQLRSFDKLLNRAEWELNEGRSRMREMTQKIETEWNVLRDHLSKENFNKLTRRRNSLGLFREIQNLLDLIT
ncbi:type II toxin-antitoxin system HipA family toxin [Glycomyces sp. YM15]|uniref:type II toxin-antitoxin system HipA family toxin n=1 Tax=Glycomyces sp. YM15 TaxID=2800446 RepID=UPI0019637F3F|nr:type II toxin-antitoxin system HipA family toxin [Glycomyces sp. YM15]